MILALVYLALGVGALFLGDITNDLLSLGMKQEVINIVSKATSAGIMGIGGWAVYTGRKLPQLPPPEDEAAPA